MDFEEWYREAKKTNDCGFAAKDFFEAGQQSKQAEIDALKSKIDGAIKYLSGGGYTPNWVVQELLK